MTATTHGAAAAAPLAAAVVEPGPLHVGGRVFVPVGRRTNFGQQMWMAPRLASSGIYDLLVGRVEFTEDWAERVLWRAADSGEVMNLLAGSLVEDGKVWTEADAIANAAFFYALEDEADCAALRAALVGLLFDFLRSGSGSLPISLSSSSPQGSSTGSAAVGRSEAASAANTVAPPETAAP
jgi:hypothetical protein